jgi:DNA repair exonuclease SbcCD ATPase subunit
MAEKIALELDVQTGKAVSNLGELEKATKQLNNTIDKSDKETQSLQQQFDSLNKEIEEAPVNIRAMNKQIQQYQAIALEAGRTSPLGKEAIQKAAALKDRYIDIQNEVNRLANDGVKLQAALDIGTTVVAGFTAFQGVMALSGVESEELRETMVKLQGAQSVLMGVETLRKNLEKESTIVLVAKNTAEKANLALTKATTIANKALGLSTDTATKSFKLMRGALIATGIGALVVLIGTLIANWDKVTKALGTTTDAQQAYNDATAKAIDSIGKELDAADKLQKTLKDDTRTREEKVQAVKDLQKEYPGLLDNVDAEKDGLIAVSEQLTKNIELITIKAQLEALAELRQEKTKENLKLIVDAQTGVNVGLTDYAAALSLGVSGQEFANFATTKAIAENKKYQDSIDGLTESLKIKMKVAIEGGAGDAEMAAEEAERLKELEKLEKEAAANAKKRADAAAKRAKRLADEEAKVEKR